MGFPVGRKSASLAWRCQALEWISGQRVTGWVRSLDASGSAWASHLELESRERTPGRFRAASRRSARGQLAARSRSTRTFVDRVQHGPRCVAGAGSRLDEFGALAKLFSGRKAPNSILGGRGPTVLLSGSGTYPWGRRPGTGFGPRSCRQVMGCASPHESLFRTVPA